MPRLVAAVFADRGNADRALQALIAEGVARDHIQLAGGEAHPSSELAPAREIPKALDLVGLGLPEEDRRLFEGALARGQVLVSVRLANDHDGSRATQILEMFDPVDLDARSAESSGASRGGGIGQGVDVGAPLGAGLTAGSGRGTDNVSAAPGMGTLTDDTSTLGTADVGTQGMSLSDQGLSATPTGGRRGDARAGAPGVNELAGGAGPAQAPGSTSAARWRDMARIGRVRSWAGNNE
jgi:hypothetical protein